ncbi:transposase family protein [Priestia filamentosa]|uniref:transposase family protein n=1 Tax=Priestia filamentosa TaxID=1402861 RepID=UPI000A089E4A|nr:transposase family protein [Priestia filamentosa]OXS64675.1 transposase [Priestia filamentosa]SMF75111.1 zinc-finger of transposase IS204/IS1001/IS1096/IS1165 [Priestia filamentosa]
MNSLSWSSPDPYLDLVHISSIDNALLLTVKSTRASAPCPNCSTYSSRPHSRYTRKVQDLPISGQPVQLLVLTRKWFCENVTCRVKVFTERYEGFSSSGRRTRRTESVLEKIAFSTSCLAAEKVAKAAHIPVSHDTLLTLIHRKNISLEVSPFYRTW